MDKQLADLFDYFEVVDLDPELAPYVYEGELGRVLHHPLVIDPFLSPHTHKIANRQYHSKLSALGNALAAKDWHTVVFLHERPYRLDAFAEFSDLMSDEEYWKVLSAIWLDTESLSSDQEAWLDMLEADRSGRALYFMDEVDWAHWHDLPDIVTVYRGYNADEGNPNGLSWTLNRDTAVWFAKRFYKEGVLLTAVVPKGVIIASLLGRGEYEVIINPNDIAGIGATETWIEAD
jgi:hypothetical protein